MFENEIMTRASRSTTREIFNALNEDGQYIKSFDPSIIEHCKKIVENFERYSDLLYCINAAIGKKDYNVKYKLQLPYTLTKNDVEVLTELLLKLELLKEVFYNKVNNSYLIEINDKSDLSISKLLTMGCAEKFLNSQYEILVSDKSFLMVRNGKIFKYHVELSAGLEINVASQPAQMRALIKKVNRKQSNISELFIVSQFVKSNLCLFENVIALHNYLSEQ